LNLGAKIGWENVRSLLPVAVYICDMEGRITFFNPCAAELWGRRPKLNDEEDKYCGSFRLMYANGAPLAVSACPMAIALRTGKTIRNADLNVQQPDGARISVRVQIDPLHDDAYTMTRVIAVARSASFKK
jgi:PAS domain-containing protein